MLLFNRDASGAKQGINQAIRERFDDWSFSEKKNLENENRNEKVIFKKAKMKKKEINEGLIYVNDYFNEFLCKSLAKKPSFI